jgi:drug/metabolite transporter (DMT)-like permease
MVAFAIIITLRKNWSKLALALKDFKALKYISIGSFFGPFIGVSLSLLAVQYISTGVASTISSVSRILIIPISIIVFKEKVSAKEILGAVITIGGVALLFM